MFYVYQAALYCEDCGTDILNDPKILADRSPRSRGYWEPTSSECCPQEAHNSTSDHPAHCRECGEILRDVTLTVEGRQYVAQALIDHTGNPEVLDEWADEYGFFNPADLDNDEVKALKDWAENVGDPEYALEKWEEAFRGIHASPEEFAWELAEAMGVDPFNFPGNYFDAEAFARDLELSGDYYFSKLGYATVAVFDNHV